MKHFLVIFALLPAVLCLSEELQELANMLHKTCQEQTGAAEEMITNAGKGDFADDQSLKCYMKCIMAQMAVMDDDGMIDVEGAIAVLPDDLKDAADTIRKCGTKVGKDACDNAWLTHKCYYETDPEHYFLV